MIIRNINKFVCSTNQGFCIVISCSSYQSLKIVIYNWFQPQMSQQIILMASTEISFYKIYMQQIAEITYYHWLKFSSFYRVYSISDSVITFLMISYTPPMWCTKQEGINRKWEGMEVKQEILSTHSTRVEYVLTCCSPRCFEQLSEIKTMSPSFAIASTTPSRLRWYSRSDTKPLKPFTRLSNWSGLLLAHDLEPETHNTQIPR